MTKKEDRPDLWEAPEFYKKKLLEEFDNLARRANLIDREYIKIRSNFQDLLFEHAAAVTLYDAALQPGN